jgi:hypothetical protein
LNLSTIPGSEKDEIKRNIIDIIYIIPIIIEILILIFSLKYFELKTKKRITGRVTDVNVSNVGLNDVGPIKIFPFNGK